MLIGLLQSIKVVVVHNVQVSSWHVHVLHSIKNILFIINMRNIINYVYICNVCTLYHGASGCGYICNVCTFTV